MLVYKFHLPIIGGEHEFLGRSSNTLIDVGDPLFRWLPLDTSLSFHIVDGDEHSLWSDGEKYVRIGLREVEPCDQRPITCQKLRIPVDLSREPTHVVEQLANILMVYQRPNKGRSPACETVGAARKILLECLRPAILPIG